MDDEPTVDMEDETTDDTGDETTDDMDDETTDEVDDEIEDETTDEMEDVTTDDGETTDEADDELDKKMEKYNRNAPTEIPTSWNAKVSIDDFESSDDSNKTEGSDDSDRVLPEIPNGKDLEKSWDFIRRHLYRPFDPHFFTDLKSPDEYYLHATKAVYNITCRRKTIKHGMYGILKAFLHDNIKSGVQSALLYTDKELIDFYNKSWSSPNFRTTIHHNTQILEYFDTKYIEPQKAKAKKRGMELGDDTMYDVRTPKGLHAAYWKEEFFDKVEKELRRWARNTYKKDPKAKDLDKFRRWYGELREDVALMS